MTHQPCGFAECPDDNLRMYTLFHKRLALFEKLSCQKNDTGCPISNLQMKQQPSCSSKQAAIDKHQLYEYRAVYTVVPLLGECPFRQAKTVT